MNLLSTVIGRLGLGINPQTGQRVRTRAVAADDWGNTHRVIEEWNPYTKTWQRTGRTGSVPGSTSGGHY